jgi:hypothetical protein
MIPTVNIILLVAKAVMTLKATTLKLIGDTSIANIDLQVVIMGQL